MESVNVDLKNCYGIAALSHKFDFAKKRQNVVYAANGVMKSSLALTFKDISEGKVSCDRIHKDRETQRSIVDENGKEISADNIFVVEPYNETYKSNRMSTLLANSRLRGRYDNVRREIDEKKDALIAVLGSSAGLKTGVEQALATDVSSDPNEFFKAIRRLKPESLIQN